MIEDGFDLDFFLARLDVSSVTECIARCDRRGLALRHGECEAPDLLPCDPWSVQVLAWIWAACRCEIAAHEYDSDPTETRLDKIQPTHETCERVRVAWLASRGVHVPSLASAPPLSVSDAAAILGLDAATLTAQVRRGEVRTVKHGARRMVPREEVARLIEAQPETQMGEDDIDAILARCRAS